MRSISPDSPSPGIPQTLDPEPPRDFSAETDRLTGEVVVVLIDGHLAAEMTYAQYLEWQTGELVLPQFAASTLQCVYVLVGVALMARAMVFFEVEVDAEGEMAPGQSVLPLRDLARRAGSGPDIGSGPVQLACRNQCSIPWFSARMWQPDLSADGDCMTVQRAVWKNGLGLKPLPPIVGSPVQTTRRASAPTRPHPTAPVPVAAGAAVTPGTVTGASTSVDRPARERVLSSSGQRPDSHSARLAEAPTQTRSTDELLDRVAQHIGRSREVDHAELESLRKQLRSAKAEIQSLRVRLRRSRERADEMEQLLSRSL